MTEEEMAGRCRDLAREALLLCDNFPRSVGSHTIAKQLSRSACSVSANYRAACRSRSKAEWLAKMGIVEEEADETIHWIQLACECKYVDQSAVQPLVSETEQILSIVIASIKTGRTKP